MADLLLVDWPELALFDDQGGLVLINAVLCQIIRQLLLHSAKFAIVSLFPRTWKVVV